MVTLDVVPAIFFRGFNDVPASFLVSFDSDSAVLALHILSSRFRRVKNMDALNMDAFDVIPSWSKHSFGSTSAIRAFHIALMKF